MQTKFLNVISSLIEILEDSILILEGLKCKLRANYKCEFKSKQ